MLYELFIILPVPRWRRL